MQIKKQQWKRKKASDITLKFFITLLSTLAVVALLVMFGVIIKEAVPGYREFGFWHMYFSADFTPSGGFGVWGPLTVTILSALLATIIATPIAVRAAILIHYRIRYGQKFVRVLVTILAGVPSVVFGIFALNSLKGFTNLFIGGSSGQTFLNGTFMLVIMIFPTLVSLILNQLKLVNPDLLPAAVALGNTRTNAIYKVVRKAIRLGVVVAVIVALGRAIGETMALSMIFASSPQANPFAGGFTEFFQSPQSSLGVSIARNMFTDSQNEINRSALLAAGIALFLITMVLIFAVTQLTRKKRLTPENPLAKKPSWSADRLPLWQGVITSSYYVVLPFKLVFYWIGLFAQTISKGFKALIYYLSLPMALLIYPKRKTEDYNEYYSQVTRRQPSRPMDIARLGLEWASFGLVLASVFWIVGDILITGVPGWTSRDWQFSYQDEGVIGPVIRKGVIGNTLTFSIVVVATSLAITAPFAFATAIYLSEYARGKRSAKILKFFLDSLNGTPSIMFGLFGLIVFVQILGVGGVSGSFSLIAGVLTMVLVILPTFTRAIEQTLIVIPDNIREASLALGASQWETIHKVVLPQAVSGIVSGLILSAGRILGETAPIYLTIGMLGNTRVDMSSQGWTMTTKIFFNQIYNVGNNEAIMKESYKIAAASLFLITALIIFAEIVPYLSLKITAWTQKWRTSKIQSRYLELAKITNHGGKSEK